MSTSGKYLVGQVVGELAENEYVAVCFPEFINHDLIGKTLFEPGSVRSGGFFQIGNDGKIVAYGESYSMDVRCDEDMDFIRIARALGLTKQNEREEVAP